MERSKDSTKSKPGRRSPHLERDKVVTTALDLLNEVGFEGLTLRRLADKLGVKAAALYWHFENKQDLIDEAAGRIISDEVRTRPIPDGVSWREILDIYGHGTRHAFMRYRDGSLVIARADLSRKTNAYSSRNIITDLLFEAGFSAHLITYAMFTITRYTLGCCLDEQSDPRPGGELTFLRDDIMPLLDEHYPSIARASREIKASDVVFDLETQFEEGLQMVLDGIAVRFAAEQAAADPS